MSVVSPVTPNAPPSIVAPVPTVNVLLPVILTLLFIVEIPVTVSVPSNAVAPLTSSVELTAVVVSVVSPVTPNAPPRVVIPFPTVNVLPAATLTLSFNVVTPATVNELSNTVAPLTSSVELTPIVVSVVSPVTPNAPPSVVAPVPTVNVLLPVTLTLLFIVEIPVTVNVPSNTVAPLTSSVELTAIVVIVVSPVTPNTPPRVVIPFPTVNVLPAATLTLSFNVVAPVTVKLSATVTSDVVCPIVTGTPDVVVPIVIPVLVSVPLIAIVEPSRVNAPELISTAPVVVISTMAALPIILTPARPSSVKAPAVVLKLEAAPASKLIPPVPAFKSNAVANVLLPIVMVLAAAPVPIFIDCASVSLPILIAPADEFIERAPAESISNPVVPSCLIVASSPAPNVIAAESLINLILSPTVTSVATAKLWFIEISPSALILIRSTPPVIILSVVSV